MLGKRPRPLHRPPSSCSLPHRHSHHHAQSAAATTTTSISHDLHHHCPCLHLTSEHISTISASPPSQCPSIPSSSASVPRHIVVGFDICAASPSIAPKNRSSRGISSKTFLFDAFCESPRSVLDASASALLCSCRNLSQSSSLHLRRAPRSGLCSSLFSDKTRESQAFLEQTTLKGENYAVELQSPSVAKEEEKGQEHVNSNNCHSFHERNSPRNRTRQSEFQRGSSCNSIVHSSEFTVGRNLPIARNSTPQCEQQNPCFDFDVDEEEEFEDEDDEMEMDVVAEIGGGAIFAAASPPKDLQYHLHTMSPPPFLLDLCCFCGSSLHGKDIFMYRGDQAFCSADCRHQQILIDET